MDWIKKHETMCQWLIAILLATTSLMQTNAANPHGAPSVDAGTFAYVGMVICHGGMPYVDVFDHKGPLLYIFNALAMGMGSWRMIAVFEAAALVAALFLILRTARLRAGFFSSLMITVLCTWLMNRYMLEGGNFTEEFALPWIALAELLFLRFFQEGAIGRRGLFAIGFSLSMIVALRPNMIAVWAIGIPVSMWLLIRQQRLRQGFRWAFGGFVAGIAPFLLWMGARGALRASWETYIVFNVHYSQKILAFSQSFMMDGKPFWKNLGHISAFRIFARHGGWQSILLCILAMAWRRHWRDSAAWASLAILVLSLLTACMSGMPFGHYAIVVLPTLAYPLAVFCEAFEQLQIRSVPAGRYVLAFGSLAFAASLLFSSAKGYATVCRQPPSNPLNMHMREAASYIRSRTSSDDRILVCGGQTAIYPFSGRFAASKYSYQYPILLVEPERMDEFFQQIDRNPPKVIVEWRVMLDYEPMKMKEFLQTHGYEIAPGYAGTDDCMIYVQSLGLNDHL